MQYLVFYDTKIAGLRQIEAGMRLPYYHSWERGLNEHTNGLIRQFFPKGTNFKIVSPEEVEKAVELINNRPRKCLDYRTPFEVFYELTSDSDALHC